MQRMVLYMEHESIPADERFTVQEDLAACYRAVASFTAANWQQLRLAGTPASKSEYELCLVFQNLAFGYYEYHDVRFKGRPTLDE